MFSERKFIPAIKEFYHIGRDDEPKGQVKAKASLYYDRGDEKLYITYRDLLSPTFVKIEINKDDPRFELNIVNKPFNIIRINNETLYRIEYNEIFIVKDLLTDDKHTYVGEREIKICKNVEDFTKSELRFLYNKYPKLKPIEEPEEWEFDSIKWNNKLEGFVNKPSMKNMQYIYVMGALIEKFYHVHMDERSKYYEHLCEYLDAFKEARKIYLEGRKMKAELWKIKG